MMEHSIEKQFINSVCRSLYAVFNRADDVIDFIENDKGNNHTVDELKN